MKTKMKSKRGKAIIGIAMAAIMVASVMLAMVTPTAAFVRDARTVAPTAAVATAPVVVIGELITLPAGITQIQYATPDPNVAGAYLPTGQILSVTALGVDTTAATEAGVYLTNLGTFVSLTDATFDANLQIGTTIVPSATSGQFVQVVVDTNLPGINYVPPAAVGGPNDCRLRIFEDGVLTTAGIAPSVTSVIGNTFVDQDASGTITTGDTWDPAGALVSAVAYSLYDADGTGAASLNDIVMSAAVAGSVWAIQTGPGGLGVGTYTVRVETYTAGAGIAAYDGKTTTKDLEVLTSAIKVEADVTTQTTNNDVVLTITAGVGTAVRVDATGAAVTFDTQKGSVPSGVVIAIAGGQRYTGTIPGTGKLTAVISSTTTGAVNIAATIPATGDSDTLDVTFRKAVTTVEVVSSFTIGDEITLSGTTTSGVDQVAIFVDDILWRIVDVEADGTYSWKWDTGTVAVPKPGSVKIKVYEIRGTDTEAIVGGDGVINSADYGNILASFSFRNLANTAARSADTSTALLAKAGDLTAVAERVLVAKGDDVIVDGSAVGQTQVHVFLIDDRGIISDATDESVLEDGSFEYSFTIAQAMDAGIYKLVVVSDGRDGQTELLGAAWAGAGWFGAIANMVGSPATVTIDGLPLSTMTQSQLLAKIERYSTGASGSDDLLVALDVNIQASSVTIIEIGGQAVGLTDKTVSIPAGDTIEVKAVSNRIDGTEFMITAENSVNPEKDLPPKTVTLTNGTITVTLDASNAVAWSTYAFKVDDLEEALDTVTVNFETGVPVATPTAAPTATPTATAIPTAAPTATPTAAPTATPTEPGFEAVFAIAGLLSIAYLVLRRRK